MNVFQAFFKTYGRREGLVRFLLYPLGLLLTMPPALFRTVRNGRELLDGRWSEWGSQFSATASINNLFYSRVALAFDREGRSGPSSLLGLGDFQLSKLYAYTLPSLYPQWRMGPFAALLGMSGFLLAQTVWTLQTPAWMVLAVMALLLFSSSFFALTFGTQNYHALGWAFVPVGLFALATQNWWLAAAAWLAVSLFSSIAVLLTLALAGALSLWNLDPWPLASFVPACCKVALQCRSAFSSTGGSGPIVFVARMMGMTHKNVRYRRRAQGSLKQVPWDFTLYSLVIYGQFCAAAWLSTGSFPVLPAAALVLFLLNGTVFRIHDVESFYMLLASVGAAFVLQANDPRLLPSLWLLVSPVPFYLSIPTNRLLVDRFPERFPFRIRPALEAMDRFLAPVGQGDVVLFAFNDPGDRFDNIFDGYRFMLELPLYAASERGARMIPDWFCVLDNNYVGAPDFWGRDVESVKANVEKWKARFVVVYRTADEPLDPVWEENGFTPLTTFNWEEHRQYFQREGSLLRHNPSARWWLLAAPREADGDGTPEEREGRP